MQNVLRQAGIPLRITSALALRSLAAKVVGYSVCLLPHQNPIPARIAMYPAHPTAAGPKQLLQLLRVHLALWLVPAAGIAAAVTVYAVSHEATWEASRALMVRNEAFHAEHGPGKFDYPEEMKTIQETILEVVRSRGVLEAALREIGPPAGYKDAAAWPSQRDIVEARKSVKLAPPKGAEFGKTEVFYLNSQAADHARSVALNEAVFQQLKAQCQRLRDVKAQSVIEELGKTVHLAKTDLDEATSTLESTEKRLGSDLAELRSMQEMASSDSAVRRSGEEIRGGSPDCAASEKTERELLAVLAKIQDNPGRLAAMPNRLLESHPALRRLKDGLIDAQLRTAALMGTMYAEHPRVRAAKESEEEIGRQLHDELTLARRGVEVELRLLAGRRAVLEDQLAKTDRRLENLAEVRARYANQVAEVKNRGAVGAGRAEPGRGPSGPGRRQGRQPHQPHRLARRRHSPGRSQPFGNRTRRAYGRTADGLRRPVPCRANKRQRPSRSTRCPFQLAHGGPFQRPSIHPSR